MLSGLRFWFASCCLLAALGALVGCHPSSPESQPKRLAVVSVMPQAWLVRQLGHPYFDVLTLVQPVDNPHTYQPTDAQVSRVMQADVFFRTGMPFEKGSWFQAIQSSQKLSIVDLRQGIPLRRMERHVHHEESDRHSQEMPQPDPHQPGGEEASDPHIWLSPRLLKIQAATVAQNLSRIDPAHQDDYQHNLQLVSRQLDQLDTRIRQRLAAAKGKAFFVFHPAWGYFADEYGLHQVAIEVEGKQPTDAELTKLQEEARREGIKVIFVQPQITGQAAGAVAAAVGAHLEQLNPEAEDVPASLLHAADAIAESYRGTSEGKR